jgi:hypothetical protein
MQLFWTFKLSLVVDVLGILSPWRLFGLLFKKLGDFLKSSGHPECRCRGCIWGVSFRNASLMKMRLDCSNNLNICNLDFKDAARGL